MSVANATIYELSFVANVFWLWCACSDWKNFSFQVDFSHPFTCYATYSCFLLSRQM